MNDSDRLLDEDYESVGAEHRVGGLPVGMDPDDVVGEAGLLLNRHDPRLDAVFRCIRVGMDPYASMLIAEFTDAEIERLDKDPWVQTRVRFEQQIKEKLLLDKLDEAMEINLRTGGTTEARWLLSRLNKQRWGNAIAEPTDSEQLPALSVSKGAASK